MVQSTYNVCLLKDITNHQKVNFIMDSEVWLLTHDSPKPRPIRLNQQIKLCVYLPL